MFNRKLLISIVTWSSIWGSTTSVAIAAHYPQICPSVEAIKAVGVSTRAVQDTTRAWFTGARDQKYGTGDHWSFVIGNIVADDSHSAYMKATYALNSLIFRFGPVQGPLGKLVCYYSTAERYAAVTMTPPVTDGYNGATVSPYLKK